MFDFFKDKYRKIRDALVKTSSLLGGRIRALFGRPWDEETFASLEQILYEADLGSRCIEELVSFLRSQLRLHPIQDVSELLALLKKKTLQMLIRQGPAGCQEEKPKVVLVVGVNGSGKTTSIAKLAFALKKEGKKVLLGAGDTFRAAAIDQLSFWAEKLSVEVVKTKPGHDPSSVAFDAINAAKARDCDVVIIDTAGRLQNKTDLMQELAKIKRTCQKLILSAPHEVLLVLDATTGQNALDQAKMFHQYVPLSGIILTKLDGSAKGGIILSIYQELNVPVRWIGVGEGAEDLIAFDPEDYVEALFGV